MDHHDVAVVGGGPAGAAAALWLARAGWDVVAFERKRFPRPKTCGDGLTPRAVRQLQDMGLASALDGHHRYKGMRTMAFGRTLELGWPHHPGFPCEGYVITRSDLDALVAQAAVKAGAVLWEGTAAAPWLGTDGELAGVVATDSQGERKVSARYVIVADGGNSRFGRAIGTTREMRWPLGMALRGYWLSDRSTEPWIESHLDLTDRDGSVVPGYGWVFPLGDGRVNVGVGLLSSSARWKGLNTSRLLEGFADRIAPSWGIDASSPLSPPTGGKLPMGLSVGPKVGKRHVVVGDAAGSINPFNGEGIAYAYETGRIAAWAVGEALATKDDSALQLYSDRLDAAYEEYYRVARLFVRLIEHPSAMAVMLKVAMRSETAMEWVVRLMANLMRPDQLGPPEAAYRVATAAVALLPRTTRSAI